MNVYSYNARAARMAQEFATTRSGNKRTTNLMLQLLTYPAFYHASMLMGYWELMKKVQDNG